jgi:phosphatidyl-myo-inositol alpha-mannosyltransferase
VRVGIVTEYARPWPGGISEHVHHEALELRASGHTVTVITGGDPSAAQQDDVLRLGRALQFTSNGARSRLAVGSFVWRLRQQLTRMRLDVLHVHAPLDPCLPLAAALSAPCPVVGTFHASFPRTALFDALYGLNPLASRAFARLHTRIAVSQQAQRSLAQYFDAPCVLIPNGVDLQRFACEPPSAPSDTFEVLFVGRDDPRKGLALLLDATTALRARGVRISLCLAGVEATRVPAAMRKYVRALGYVAPEGLPALYVRADVVCSPATSNESQGIVLLEAMASGRPCVCFDIPGYRDVIEHERTGLLVREPSTQALAAALQRLAEDADLRARLGSDGRQAAQAYAWPNVAARIEAVLTAAASGP